MLTAPNLFPYIRGSIQNPAALSVLSWGKCSIVPSWATHNILFSLLKLYSNTISQWHRAGQPGNPYAFLSNDVSTCRHTGYWKVFIPKACMQQEAWIKEVWDMEWKDRQSREWERESKQLGEVRANLCVTRSKKSHILYVKQRKEAHSRVREHTILQALQAVAPLLP